MKQIWRIILLCLGLYFCGNAAANNEFELPNFSLIAKQADWFFYGIVTNEDGEHYNYVFQFQRDKHKFHTIAVLMSEQLNKPLLYEEGSAYIDDPDRMHWKIGATFLQFNAINNSWVFGVKTKDGKGFNFKVDMLRLSNSNDKFLAKHKDLYTGLKLLIGHTGRLNGHLKLDKDSPEEFVIANQSWLRQIWIDKMLHIHKFTQPVQAVLCDFNNGSGFYAVHVQESRALQGAVAGWLDRSCNNVPMSQFVTVNHQHDGIWRIHIPVPKSSFSLKDIAVKKDSQLILGPIDGNNPGFCSISQYHLPIV